MMVPVRCFTCGNTVGEYWEEYQARAATLDGDEDPEAIVRGAIQALHQADEDLSVLLVGPEEQIREVLDALQGERIDIYEWSKDPITLISNALEPAKVVGINPDHKEKSAVVIVEDRYYTSAIGAKGQNARLAAQSSGWKIDIKSISDAKEMGINYTPIDQKEF